MLLLLLMSDFSERPNVLFWSVSFMLFSLAASHSVELFSTSRAGHEGEEI